jgi:hypothetical protein
MVCPNQCHRASARRPLNSCKPLAKHRAVPLESGRKAHRAPAQVPRAPARDGPSACLASWKLSADIIGLRTDQASRPLGFCFPGASAHVGR